MLHDTYENNDESRKIFEEDLNTGFFWSDGFNERVYRNNYMRHFTTSHIETIDLTVEDIAHDHDQRVDLLHETIEESTISRQTSVIHDDIIENTDDFIENNNGISERGGNNNRRRGGNNNRRKGGNNNRRSGGNNSRRRGGNNSGSNTRNGSGNGRRLRSQNQRETWNVMLPENMEDQVRSTRSTTRNN